MLEYRWGVHILLKSADDIRQLDRNLQSLYSFSSLRKEFPTLPTLRAPRPGKNESVDGYVVAEDLRQYFQVLLRLDGSAFCADLLSLQCLSFFIPSFLEIPVSPRSFQYSPQTSNFSDSSLFLSPVCSQTHQVSKDPLIVQNNFTLKSQRDPTSLHCTHFQRENLPFPNEVAPSAPCPRSASNSPTPHSSFPSLPPAPSECCSQHSPLAGRIPETERPASPVRSSPSPRRTSSSTSPRCAA